MLDNSRILDIWSKGSLPPGILLTKLTDGQIDGQTDNAKCNSPLLRRRSKVLKHCSGLSMVSSGGPLKGYGLDHLLTNRRYSKKCWKTLHHKFSIIYHCQSIRLNFLISLLFTQWKAKINPVWPHQYHQRLIYLFRDMWATDKSMDLSIIKWLQSWAITVLL